MKRFLFLFLSILTITANSQVKDTCEIWFNDTVRYIDAKTSSYSGISINQVNDAGYANHGYAGFAQKFEAPDTVTVLGMCFYGVMDTGADGTAEVKMYDGAGGVPGAVIAATTHVIPYFGTGYTGAMNDPVIFQCAMFSTPVQWEGDYILSIENHTTSDMYIARNATGDGAAENISYTYYEGVSDPTYDGWYRMYSDFGAAWDFDVIIEPVVGYYSRSIISYDTTVCFGDTLFLEYDYMLDDSLMFNKFYNPTYSSYTGYSTTHTFDYGDLTAVTGDTLHEYSSAGMYDVTHSAVNTVSAWGTTSFSGECMVSTEIVDPYFDIQDQSACAGDSVYFVAPMGYDGYLWNDLSYNDSLFIDTDGMINGAYKYYVDYDLKGCLSSDTMMLNVGDLMIDLGDDTTLCLNQNISLTAGTYDSYDWNTGQMTEVIQVGPFANPGSEEIILTVMQGNCSGTDTLLVIVDNCLGVEGYEGLAVDIYPNPNNGVVNVTSNVKINSVALYNLVGEKVFETKVVKGSLFDFQNIENGVYFMQVMTESGVVGKKIQIIR